MPHRPPNLRDAFLRERFPKATRSRQLVRLYAVRETALAPRTSGVVGARTLGIAPALREISIRQRAPYRAGLKLAKNLSGGSTRTT